MLSESVRIMDKLLSFVKKPVGKIVCILLIPLVVMVILAMALKPANSTQLAKSMENTKDPIVTGDVKLTTDETLRTVSGQQEALQNQIKGLENEKKEFEAEMAKKQEQEKNQVHLDLEAEKQSILLKLSKIQKKDELTAKPIKKVVSHGYVIGDVSQNKNDAYQWISEPAPPAKVEKTSLLTNNNTNDLDDSAHLKVKKPTIKPFYTIPPNSALINIRPLQPLIGVIATNGTVLDPETVLFTVGKKGLLANGWNLPNAIKGVQGSATCSGVFNFNHSSVKCGITSLTFIFQNGTISTVNGTSGKPLGKLTDHYGNDYIAGQYYGNVGYAAAGTGFFSAIQGWGGAFSQSQVETNSNAAGTFSSTTFKNADAYAGGQALQETGRAFNEWWSNLLKSTTNYVFVPNWDKSTGQYLILNAVINQSVDINYNSSNRKVNYDNNTFSQNNSLD